VGGYGDKNLPTICFATNLIGNVQTPHTDTIEIDSRHYNKHRDIYTRNTSKTNKQINQHVQSVILFELKDQ
jgi:hypothetical protein